MNRRSVRRRVRTRTALFLCIFGAVGMMLVSVLASLAGAALRPWISAAGTLLFFAVPAYLGLFQIDGDQSHLLLRQKLSSAQTLWLAASGVMTLCPSLLVSGVMQAVLSMFGISAAQAQGTLHAGTLLPVLLSSGVIAPLSEELFFRGYLLGVFSGVGKGSAALLTALVFAAAHGLSAQTPVLILLGLLFAALTYHTQSLLAPVLVHMAYNMTLILLSFSGLGGLLMEINPVTGLLLLLGCAGFAYALGRAWRAQGAYEQMRLERGRISFRQLLPVLLALLLVIAAQLAPSVFGAVSAWLAERAAAAEAAKAAMVIVEVLA